MASILNVIVVLCLTSGLWIGANAQCDSECQSCPSGFTEHEKYCYQFNGAQKTWAEAEVACIEKGGNLASLANPAAFKFVRELVKAATDKDEKTWVGAHDTPNEGVWLWSDGAQFGPYKPWAAGQPDNAGNNEDCMEINFNGAANDLPCSTKRAFVCGKSL